MTPREVLLKWIDTFNPADSEPLARLISTGNIFEHGDWENNPVQEGYSEENCYITELLNTHLFPSVSVARARVLPGETTRWHWLDGIAEHYLIMEGAGRAGIADEPEIQVKSGDSITIPPGIRQRITNNGNSDLIFLAVCTPRFENHKYLDEKK